LLLAGGFICGHAAVVLDQKDPRAVVYDEYATVAGVFILLPWDRLWCPGVLTVGFLLHRLFDVTKVWPVGALERLPGGWGIMTDDIAAGFLAGAILRGLIAAGAFDGWSVYF
ncbi:MAG TPA: phosphatidylglycerophosphatase A, partial [Pirellulales bacterium]